MRSASLPALSLWLAISGWACATSAPPRIAVPFGAPAHGYLQAGVELPMSGPGFVRARPTDPTHFGTPTLVGALTRAAAEVESRFPGTPPVRIGDLASPFGGRHTRHHSHRTGRDADVMYYAVDDFGAPVDGTGHVGYNRFGYGLDGSSGQRVWLDVARTWAFIRTLLLDDDARVQWVFCSWGVKQRLLGYALAHETNPEALYRAADVLHQPGDSAPHHDHMHVRVACSASERAAGCIDRGPLWAWLRRDHEKPAGGDGHAASDEQLVAWLMSDDGGELDRADAERVAEAAAPGSETATISPVTR